MLIVLTLSVPFCQASQASTDTQSLKKHLNLFQPFLF